MKLLITGSSDTQVVTPEELRQIVGYLVETHPQLPEFVTEVLTIISLDQPTIGVCADIYAKHNRLPRRVIMFSIDKEVMASEMCDAAICFGDDNLGIIKAMSVLNKPCLVLPYPTPPELGVMTGIDATGERVPLSLEEQEKLDRELIAD